MSQIRQLKDNLTLTNYILNSVNKVEMWFSGKVIFMRVSVVLCKRAYLLQKYNLKKDQDQRRM